MFHYLKFMVSVVCTSITNILANFCMYSMSKVRHHIIPNTGIVKMF